MVDTILQKLSNDNFIAISEEQLDELKNNLRIVKEEDTIISDFIRIFEEKDYFIFQETTPKNEIIIRKMNNIAEAEFLLQQRLDVYEKMWNGCGCKIDYTSAG